MVVEIEKTNIRKFLQAYFTSSAYSQDYGMQPGSPVRFTIWRERDGKAPVLNHIYVSPNLRRKGLASCIFDFVESHPTSTDCWVRYARTPEIRSLLGSRGYKEVVDHDYVKVIRPELSDYLARERGSNVGILDRLSRRCCRNWSHIEKGYSRLDKPAKNYR